MKTMLAAVIAPALFATLAGSALAAEETTAKPIVMKDKITVTATVEAIDRENRTVTLKGPQGNEVLLAVDDNVTRFDNLKVGDKVSAQYYESVAYDIKKPGTTTGPDTITRQAGKYTGDKPGGGVTNTSVSTVTIVAIDPDAPAVTIRTSDGAIETYAVRHPENLKKVKVGDVVVVTQKQSLMIGVEPAK
jgi:ABC-type Fe3+-hydroxamate transport system substrate-binding protein